MKIFLEGLQACMRTVLNQRSMHAPISGWDFFTESADLVRHRNLKRDLPLQPDVRIAMHALVSALSFVGPLQRRSKRKRRRHGGHSRPMDHCLLTYALAPT